MSVYGKYSRRRHVQRQTKHEAKLSAVFISRHAPEYCTFMNISTGSALSGILYYELLIIEPIS